MVKNAKHLLDTQSLFHKYEMFQYYLSFMQMYTILTFFPQQERRIIWLAQIYCDKESCVQLLVLMVPYEN